MQAIDVQYYKIIDAKRYALSQIPATDMAFRRAKREFYFQLIYHNNAIEGEFTRYIKCNARVIVILIALLTLILPIIFLTKTTAAQNEVALNCRRVRGLFFWGCFCGDYMYAIS